MAEARPEKENQMIARLPPWFRQEIPKDIDFIRNRLRYFENHKLNTVCVSAHCPNINHCFENGSATFMILGDNCSRDCRFCAVNKGRPEALELSEPYNLALTIRRLDLKYVVLTSVTRDDLVYGGASQYARAVYLIKQFNPGKKIELLIPDFRESADALSLVAVSCPDVIAHNLETVERMYPYVRPLGDYRRALRVLKRLKELGFAGLIKSGIMLGFGEQEEEVLAAIEDLNNSCCDIITLGQYLAPGKGHFPVKEFISPEKFEFYRQKALKFGFKAVYAGALVRSSYRAGEVFSDLVYGL